MFLIVDRIQKLDSEEFYSLKIFDLTELLLLDSLVLLIPVGVLPAVAFSQPRDSRVLATAVAPRFHLHNMTLSMQINTQQKGK